MPLALRSDPQDLGEEGKLSKHLGTNHYTHLGENDYF